VPTDRSSFIGRIYRISATAIAGTPVLVDNAADPSGLVFDAEHVYWSDEAAGHIKRARR